MMFGCSARMWVVVTLTGALGIGCTSVQKTPGGGLTSAVAQNVVRIACSQALEEADFSAVKGQPVSLNLTGFADDKNSGILLHLFREKAEESGALFVPHREPVYEIEVAALAAGNDQGRSRRIISSSERVEGTVDVEMTIRRTSDGSTVNKQHLWGRSKYQQTRTLGFQGAGKYYVQNDAGHYVRVPAPGRGR